MASRKRKAAPTQSTTIDNFFFARVNVTLAAPEVAEESPGKWLPPPPPRASRVSQTLGGALRIQCQQLHCRKTRGPEQFVPEQNPRDAAAYTEALAALGEARAAKDGGAFLVARDIITTLAIGKCLPCRVIDARSDVNPKTSVGACRAEWERLKAEEFHTCRRCGAQRSVEADHGDAYAANAKAHAEMVKTYGREAADAAYPAAERKLASLSGTKNYWCYHGGVAGMRAEAAKCEPLCRMCHALDPSSSSAPQNAASRAKAEAKEYETEMKRVAAVRRVEYNVQKRAYVNAIKRKIGTCERPDCPCDGPSNGRCVAGFEPCYDLDHIVEATKGRALGKIVRDRRCFAAAKPEILAEIGLPLDFDVENDPIPPVAARRCRLLCRNCHLMRKEWDA